MLLALSSYRCGHGLCDECAEKTQLAQSRIFEEQLARESDEEEADEEVEDPAEELEYPDADFENPFTCPTCRGGTGLSDEEFPIGDLQVLKEIARCFAGEAL